MVVLMLSRSPYPTTVMESDSDFSAVRTATLSTDANFAFAFNDSNFSDRLLRIKIMGDSPESRPDSEACTSIADWAHHRKRRREDFKDTAVVELTDCLEEQILNDNQPDMDDEPCENQDEDAIAMVEESPSGDYSNGKEGEGQSTQYKDMSSYYNDQRVQQPCHLSSSIYYGGQDIYHHTPSQENDSTYKRDGTDDDGTACRGNWWQGSLYY